MNQLHCGCGSSLLLLLYLIVVVVIVVLQARDQAVVRSCDKRGVQWRVGGRSYARLRRNDVSILHIAVQYVV